MFKKGAYLNFTRFRNSPAPFLRRIEKGESLVLTHFGRPIAKIIPPDIPDDSDRSRTAILSAAGMLEDLPKETQRELQRIFRSGISFRKRRPK